jgi:hypothetical protein
LECGCQCPQTARGNDLILPCCATAVMTRPSNAVAVVVPAHLEVALSVERKVDAVVPVRRVRVGNRNTDVALRSVVPSGKTPTHFHKTDKAFVIACLGSTCFTWRINRRNRQESNLTK